MKTYLVLVILFFIFITIRVDGVFADLINLDYSQKTCAHGEIEIECTYRSTTPFASPVIDGCAAYKDNPNVRFLVGEGHSFGGKSKFCTRLIFQTGKWNISAIVIMTRRTGLQIIGTLFFELPVFWLFGIKGKKNILLIILANAISVTAFSFTSLFIDFNISMIILMELLIVLFETAFLSVGTHIPIKRIALATTVANVSSAVVGSALAAALSLYF